MVFQCKIQVIPYIQVEFLERPVVRLSHKLSGGSDVRLRNEQASQPHVQILKQEKSTLHSRNIYYYRMQNTTHNLQET